MLITGARAPAGLHLARLMHGAGHRVIMADSLRQTISSVSTACDAYEVLPRPIDGLSAYAEAVKQVITRHNITQVIPTCEEVFYLAQIWSDAMPAQLFAPDISLLARAHNKYDFTQLAQELGLPVPQTYLLTDPADLEKHRAQSRDLVFKPVWSRFATNVLIRPDPRKLTFKPTLTTPWVAQEFIKGTELCAYAFATRGQLNGLSIYAPRYRAGKGAAVYFDPVIDPGITDFITTFAAGIDWTGQLSFDFIRTAQGKIYALECNPRAVSGIHFFHNARAFSTAFSGHGFADPDIKTPLTVPAAMWIYAFPKAVAGLQFGQFFQDIRCARHALQWDGDPGPQKQQLRSVAEIARIALARRISLQAASTFDIEWNGPDQSSM